MPQGPSIGILSMAYYLPSHTKSVEEVFRDEAIPTEPLAAKVDFRRDIGIEKVHVASGELPSAVGLEASRRALEKASIDPAEIDLIVDFTSIPEDYVAPTWSAAGLVQKEIGARNAIATAVNTGGCASYHVALKTACAMMAADDRMTTALLFAGDKTPPLNRTYYPITVTCDGGSAVVLRKGATRRVILGVEVATVGKLHDVWYVPGFTNRKPDEPLTDRLLYMNSNMQRFNEGVITVNLFMFRKVMKAVLARSGLKSTDVSYYIYPTFSTWDQKTFCQALAIPREKVYLQGLGRHGHLQENDMIMNYVDAADDGLIGDGDLVMVTTNGAGFVWGAALVRH